MSSCCVDPWTQRPHGRRRRESRPLSYRHNSTMRRSVQLSSKRSETAPCAAACSSAAGARQQRQVPQYCSATHTTVAPHQYCSATYTAVAPPRPILPQPIPPQQQPPQARQHHQVVNGKPTECCSLWCVPISSHAAPDSMLQQPEAPIQMVEVWCRLVVSRRTHLQGLTAWRTPTRRKEVAY